MARSGDGRFGFGHSGLLLWMRFSKILPNLRIFYSCSVAEDCPFTDRSHPKRNVVNVYLRGFDEVPKQDHIVETH